MSRHGVKCAVPDYIHTPPWKRTGKFRGGGILKKTEPFKEGRKLIKIKISRGDKDQTKNPFMGGVWTCSKTTP